MKVIKESPGTVPFEMLYRGQVFENPDTHHVYMKTTVTKYSNAVSVDGVLALLKPDRRVILKPYAVLLVDGQQAEESK